MLPASIKMRPDGKLIAISRLDLPHKQSGLPKAPGNRHSGIASYGNQSPLPLFETLSEATEGFGIPVGSDPVHRIPENPPNLRITVPICRHRKIKRPHSVRHPQPISRGKVDHTLRGMPWQEKPLWGL
jgi:hypothetical protein